MKLVIFFLLTLSSTFAYPAKPNFSNPSQIDVEENTDFVATIEATDPDGTSVTYTLVKSYKDTVKFFIGPTSGQLYFNYDAGGSIGNEPWSLDLTSNEVRPYNFIGTTDYVYSGLDASLSCAK